MLSKGVLLGTFSVIETICCKVVYTLSKLGSSTVPQMFNMSSFPQGFDLEPWLKGEPSAVR